MYFYNYYINHQNFLFLIKILENWDIIKAFNRPAFAIIADNVVVARIDKDRSAHLYNLTIYVRTGIKDSQDSKNYSIQSLKCPQLISPWIISRATKHHQKMIGRTSRYGRKATKFGFVSSLPSLRWTAPPDTATNQPSKASGALVVYLYCDILTFKEVCV